jgi:hypothetical protein
VNFLVPLNYLVAGSVGAAAAGAAVFAVLSAMRIYLKLFLKDFENPIQIYIA